MSGNSCEGAKGLAWRGGAAGVGTLWAAAVLGAVLVVSTIPWHMDEFIMYHVLACWEPSQQLNVYHQSCTAYPTRLGPIEFQRAYWYAGITSSLLLAPFHAVSQSIWTTYAVGALALAGTAWGLAASFMLPWRMMPALLLFFPLVFATLRDGGPVRVSLLVMAWTPMVTAQYLKAGRFRFLWAALLAVMWAVAVEDKPFFVYLMPGIVVLSIASLSSKGVLDQAWRSWKALMILFGLTGIFCISLLAAMQARGMSYLHLLANISSGRRSVEATIDSAISGIFLTLDWPFYANRVSDYRALAFPGSEELLGKLIRYLPVGWSLQAVAVLTLTALVALLVAGLYLWAISGLLKSSERTDRNTALLLLLAAGVLWVSTVASGGKHSHHYVYAQVPLLVLLASAFGRYDWGHLRLGAALGGLTLASLIAIWLVPARHNASPEIPIAFEAALAAADSDTIINCGSWGCYFTYSLLNRRNIPVVFADSRRAIRRLQKDAKRLNKRIVHLCVRCDLPAIQRHYPQSAVSQVDSDTTQWRVYRVDPSVQPAP